ncbi:hypothetical protein QFZ83_000720 [Variovorax sp. W1I1]|nr:hypothetical protein [Variovorax sp. W1I1]
MKLTMRAPALRCRAQLAEHARMVGAGVLAEDEDGVGLLEIFERDRALAHADLRTHAAAAGLVAHVRAVGKIVGAVLADEELVQERSLVASAARGVEDGLVRIGQRVEVARDQCEGVVPFDGHVLVARCVVGHRVREAALVFEPEIALFGQLRHGVLGEEIRASTARGGLGSHGLHAVLAKLESGCVVAVGPGAAGAVETVGLVGREQRLGALEGNVLPQQRVRHAAKCAPAACGALVKLDLLLTAHAGECSPQA